MKVSELRKYLNSLVADDARWDDVNIDVVTMDANVHKVKSVALEACEEDVATSVFLTIEV